MENAINNLLGKFLGIRLIKESTYKEYAEMSWFKKWGFFEVNEFVDLLKTIEANNLSEMLEKSKAQIFQDVFVAISLGFKRDGFFVEFGASDGIDLSNTYMLEKEYNWNGILAEPSKYYHKDLHKNRNCIIDERCVYTHTGKLIEFNDLKNSLSTINTYSNNDCHTNHRQGGDVYQVETISLLDMLDQNNCPKIIDYLSIDTEGSELDILQAFDFAKYSFRIITVEHNYTTDQRGKIKLLLESKGYKKVYEHLSKWDDWYILN